MYDEYARELINSIPALPELDKELCRRSLSAAYLHILRSTLSLGRENIPTDDLQQIKATLRGLGDALESVAIFDHENNVEWSSRERESSAFVAAEALFLLGQIYAEDDHPFPDDPLRDQTIYVTVESALLYMVGGYDVNAVSTIRTLPLSGECPEEVSINQQVCWNKARYLLRKVAALCRGDVGEARNVEDLPCRVPEDMGNSNLYEDLVTEIRAQLYEEIANSLNAYLGWLGGTSRIGYEECTSNLNELCKILSDDSRTAFITPIADIYHLCSVLLTAVEQTATRSLIHNIPYPQEGEAGIIENYREYLIRRAQGKPFSSGRPFMWPSNKKYVDACLPGPHKDAVISMPTGSGKSFIAEIALTHALCKGWVLYLAPTNALAHQIRRDLSQALRPFEQVSVRAFIGTEEYTTLTEEYISETAEHFVAVMTPEKCALALRLFPDRFASCTLCVFDECHLLNDSNRGTTADIVLAQLSTLSPDLHFLLMSAMVNNPTELAEWLGSTHNKVFVAPLLKWRPSRTLRGLVVLEQQALRNRFENAQRELDGLPQYRKTVGFDVPLALIVGLSGPWTRNGAIDYRMMKLPLEFESRASRRPREIGRPLYPSWKNTTARHLGEFLAAAGKPVLCLILTSKHHTFSNAQKITLEMPNSLGPDDQFSPIIDAWLNIADAELGVETGVRDLLRRGVGVHSSAMLQVEQAATERMFVEGTIQLMCATPTLAQGLNLPAVAVVVAGSSMGDPRNAAQSDTIDGISRVNSLILNGFGRAGRPGITNHGIAILVTDNPYYATVAPNLDPSNVLNKYSVLGEEDAAIEVQSPIGGFIDLALTDPELETATSDELALVSLLAEYNVEDERNASSILSRTLAVHQKRGLLPPNAVDYIQERITQVKATFLEQPDVPQWINQAAMKAGVDFFRAWHIWQAYQIRGVVSIDNAVDFSVDDWFRTFIEVMTLLPPYDIQLYLAREELRTENILTRLRDAVQGQEYVNSLPWEMHDDWPALWETLGSLVHSYMGGDTYAQLARRLLELSPEEPIDNSRSSGAQHIPKVFAFLRKVVHHLAIDAGCFAAVYEFGTSEAVQPLPDGLQALPLCIRNGCDSIGVLAWYRFGYRQRMCAHAFQRAFPVPDALEDDQSRLDWITETRRRWLSGEIETRDYPLLDHAKTVIQESI